MLRTFQRIKPEEFKDSGWFKPVFAFKTSQKIDQYLKPQQLEDDLGVYQISCFALEQVFFYVKRYEEEPEGILTIFVDLQASFNKRQDPFELGIQFLALLPDATLELKNVVWRAMEKDLRMERGGYDSSIYALSV